jgi:Methyltransferase small domain
MDAFFTPTDVAHFMADLRLGFPKVVADFTSGDGSLLSAARKRWPSCKLIATDINPASLRNVHTNLPGVKTGKCNFLSARSRASCRVLKNIRGKVSLILLNPPFSCRGGTKRSVLMANAPIDVSVALAFVLTAFEYLEPGGQLIALLPSGCLRSEKDARAWEILQGLGYVETVKTNGNSVFEHCRPATCIVRITRNSIATNKNKIENDNLATPQVAGKIVELIRGRRPMFSVKLSRKRGGIPFIHSTELSNAVANLSKRFVAPAMSDVYGPVVLIPRVGLPRRDKIALLTEPIAISLSDCVFAVRCATAQEATLLHMRIVLEWRRFCDLYSGTGAPYLTARRLTMWLVDQRYDIAIESIKSRQLRGVVEDAIADCRAAQKTQNNQNALGNREEREPHEQSVIGNYVQ